MYERNRLGADLIADKVDKVDEDSFNEAFWSSPPLDSSNLILIVHFANDWWGNFESSDQMN